ncbi:MAG: hypothetical protein HONBIEJF_00680 [Fimbriimonadaceae bacterium]|nr:hypothetical protein [Fimbriimonadaceae bacterium]
MRNTPRKRSIVRPTGRRCGPSGKSDMHGMLQIKLLGKLEAQVREMPPVQRFRSTSSAAVLAYLALFINRAVSKDEICDAVWPESDRYLARSALRTALHSLRAAVSNGMPGDALIRSDRNSVWLDPDFVTCDHKLFQDQAREGLSASSASDRSELLARAFHIVNGPLLPEIEDWWVRPHKIAFEEVFGQAVSQLIRDLTALDQVETAIAIGRLAVSVAPLREDIHIELIRLFNSLGRGSEAIKQYELLEGLLVEQWGEHPSDAATQALDSQPEVRSISTIASAVRAQATRMFGREAETRYIVGLLSGGARLVSIVGFGGCGKTAIAKAVMDHFDKAVFVDLATIRTLDSVMSQVAAAIGMRDAIFEKLPKHVAAEIERCGILLVLDNAEHIVGKVSDAVAALLSDTTTCRVLVTSRTPLGLASERVLRLNPLPLPETEWPLARILETPTVQMFEHRARFVSDCFAVTTQNVSAVVELCRRTDGIPLAIELLAAKVESLSPAQILVRLADRTHTLKRASADISTRHRSLELAAAWSYELLDSNQQRALRALSVFRQSFALEDAEVIAACAIGGDTVEALFRASLLEQEVHDGDVRFRMLAPLRGFAWDRLLQHGEMEEVCLRHRKRYLEKAEQIWRDIDGGSPGKAADEAKLDEHNFLQILDWSIDWPDWAPDALRLCSCLTHYVNLRARNSVWMPRLQRLLQVHEDTLDDESKARGWVAVGAIAMFQPDMALCLSSLRKGFNLYQRLGNKVNIAGAANTLGLALVCMPHNDPHNVEEALPLLARALEDIDGQDDAAHWNPKTLRAAILSNLAAGYRVQNRNLEALESLREGLRLALAAGAYRYVPGIQLGIADNLMDLCRFDEAKLFASSAFESAESIDSLFLKFQSRMTLAWTCHELGEKRTAVEAACEGLLLARKTGSAYAVATALIAMACLLQSLGHGVIAQALFDCACRVSPLELGNIRGPAASSIPEMCANSVPGLPIGPDDPVIDELVSLARAMLLQSGTSPGS